MLFCDPQVLDSKRIVLASGSVGRQQMLKEIGINAELCTPLFDENLDPNDFPNCSEFVEETAKQKVEEIYERLENENQENSEKKPDIIIGADTMVSFDRKMYGKPKTRQEAIDMLKRFSGNCNTVHTGVVIKYADTIYKFTETTKVFFDELDAEDVEAYVDTEEPFKCAGGYAIQGGAFKFIQKIEGDYNNVCGLPTLLLDKKLSEILKNE